METKVSGTDEFHENLLEYMRPYEGKFNYDNIYKNHLDISRFRSWVRQIDQIKKVNGCDVFSSGCGSAGDLYCFLESGARSAVGVEMDSKLTRLGKSRFRSGPLENKALIVEYNGDVLPFQDASFDIVFSMHVVEHVNNIDRYLYELFRTLKKDGILFLDIPNRYFPMEQHTLLPFLHYLPLYRKDRWIPFLISGPIGRRISEDVKYRLHSLTGIHIPWPHQLLRLIQRHSKHLGLKIIQAGFHSHTEKFWNFKWWLLPWAIAVWGKRTTLRIVVQQTSTPKNRHKVNT